MFHEFLYVHVYRCKINGIGIYVCVCVCARDRAEFCLFHLFSRRKSKLAVAKGFKITLVSRSVIVNRSINLLI